MQQRSGKRRRDKSESIARGKGDRVFRVSSSSPDRGIPFYSARRFPTPFSPTLEKDHFLFPSRKKKRSKKGESEKTHGYA